LRLFFDHLTFEGIANQLIDQTIALARRGVVVFGNTGYICFRLERMHEVAEGEHLPARVRHSFGAARKGSASCAASAGPAFTLPSPYLSATKPMKREPAIIRARLMASSVAPSQLGASNSRERFAVMRSSHTSAPMKRLPPAPYETRSTAICALIMMSSIAG
jgi:hypothetical protein